MNNTVSIQAERFRRSRIQKNIWYRVLCVLAGAVVFVTTYAMILPAITLESTPDVYCGMTEHIHGDKCFETAGIPEHKALSCDISSLIHIHTDDCFGDDGMPECGMYDYIVHTHNSFCFDGGEMICRFGECNHHVHTDECSDGQGGYICGKTTPLVHQHTADCVTVVDAVPPENLICTLTEHLHTEDCMDKETAYLGANTPVVYAAPTIRNVTLTLADDVTNSGCYRVAVSDPNGNLNAYDGRVSFNWYKSSSANTTFAKTAKKNFIVENSVVSNLRTDIYRNDMIDLALDNGSLTDNITWTRYYAVLCIDGEETNVTTENNYLTNTTYYRNILNGDFEKPIYSSNAWNQAAAGGDVKWLTTSSSNIIEIVRLPRNNNSTSDRWAHSQWAQYYSGSHWQNGWTWTCDDWLYPVSGNQYAEISAEDDSAMYQTLLTIPGTVMNWRLSHAQRPSEKVSRPDGDIMFLCILPDTEGSMYSTTDALREHIRELLALGDGTEYYDRERGIYVKKLTDKAVDGWGQYSGTYYIPEGQHLTRYFFVSEKVSGSSPSSGNFLDDVWFNQELPPAKKDDPQIVITKQVKMSASNVRLTDDELFMLLSSLQFEVVDYYENKVLMTINARELASEWTDISTTSGWGWNQATDYAWKIEKAIDITSYIENYGWEGKTIYVREKVSTAGVAGYTFVAEGNNAENKITVDLSTKGKYTFTNTYTKNIVYYSLKVTKVVNAPTTDGVFDILISRTDHGEDTVTKNYQLRDGESVSLSHIPANSIIKIAEPDHDGYHVSIFEGTTELANGNSYAFALNRDTEIVVRNTASVPLPETGGIGTALFTYAGLSLMAVSVVGGYILRRTKRREAEQ